MGNSPENWGRVKELFEAALERDPARRSAYLLENTADPKVREEVERLLMKYALAGSFLSTPVFECLKFQPSELADRFLPGEILAGRFQVVHFIAAGGMGEVYEAQDLELRESLAIKTIKPEVLQLPNALARFKREVHLARKVTHPNVCRVFDLFRYKSDANKPDSEGVFISMELLTGESLSERIRRGIFTPQEALPLIAQMAAGLAAAHHAGVVHRDFKPGNVVLVSERDSGRIRVAITDFGLAFRSGGDASLTADFATASGIFGTPAYMAPEQIEGREVTSAADIYALGLVIHEMVTGLLPFASEPPLSMVAKRVHEPAPSPRLLMPCLDAAWESTILRCLEREPGKRFQEVEEVVQALQVEPKTIPIGSDLGGVSLAKPPLTTIHDKTSRPDELQTLSVRLNQSTAQKDVGGSQKRNYAFVGAICFLLVLTVIVVSFREFDRGAWQRLLGPNIPNQKNLVVLPFSAVDGQPSEQIYCQGFTETVTAKLANVASLQVQAAQKVRDYRVASIQEARNRLGANLVLTATWQRSQNSARINLSLVDAKTGQQLRTDTITEPAGDLFRLQDHVVLTASRMLELQLSANSTSALTSHGTTVATAYDLYLQGIAYLQRYERPENLETSINLFRRAIAEDPAYAQAQAALAQAYWYKHSATQDPQWGEKAKIAVKAARDLDSQLPEVQLAIADLSRRTGAYLEALSGFQRTLQLDPENVAAYLGLGSSYDSLGRAGAAEQAFRHAIEISPECWNCYNELGYFFNEHARYGEAAEAWQRVTELTPDNVWGYMNVGAVYFNLGQFGKADEYFRRGLQIAPDNADLYSNAGTVSFFLGRFEEDATYCQKAIELSREKYVYWGNLGDAYRMIPRDSSKSAAAYQEAIRLAEIQLKLNPSDSSVLSSLAIYYARTNDATRAEKYLDRALKASPRDVDVLRIACLVHLEAGERQEALLWLQKAVGAGYAKAQLLANPELASLRSDPQFDRLANQAKSYQ
jgi:serine/threonine protein kinase/tetratricopeptide (TPR) repeat protein